jgi:hypothetical protein
LGGDQARGINPYQDADGEEGWRIIIIIQNQDRPLKI